nr:MAG TPA: hypothetical protein [Caudoviricetes sp.]
MKQNKTRALGRSNKKKNANWRSRCVIYESHKHSLTIYSIAQCVLFVNTFCKIICKKERSLAFFFFIFEMKNKATIKLIYSISHLIQFCQSCQAHVRVL